MWGISLAAKSKIGSPAYDARFGGNIEDAMYLVPNECERLSMPSSAPPVIRMSEANSPILCAHFGRAAVPDESVYQRIRPAIRSPPHLHLGLADIHRDLPRHRPVRPRPSPKPAHQDRLSTNLAKRRYTRLQEPTTSVNRRLHVCPYGPTEIRMQRGLLLDTYDQSFSWILEQKLRDLGDHRLERRQLRPESMEG